MKSNRLILLAVLSGLWLCAILFRLYDLQVNRHDSFRDLALRQQQKMVKLHPPRGTIFDAAGRELAVSVEVSSATANPQLVEDPAATAAALATVLEVDVERLERALASDREFVWVKRKLDPPQAARVRALELEGVQFVRESKRYYPLRSLAAQVLGYVGTDNTGLAGLEFLYDDTVASEPGRRKVVRDARRGTVLYPNLERADAKPGKDLHLTLDAAIQHVVERELTAAIESTGASKGMVVVMDPATGGILAMASHPTFDPNDFNAYPKSHWRNQPVQDVFEPGSTFKLVTLAAALEEGVVDPLETIDCEMGGITLSGVRIADHRSFGDLTTREIIAKSSNVGTIKLGFAAGRERLWQTIGKLGFGRPTGIDLPSESSGISRPIGSWSKLSPAYISFGHGISVTGLQLTGAFAVIANGGRLVEPYIVASVGDEPARKTVVRDWPISPSSVRQARSMLESVVIEGTAKAAALPGYRAAGKTGTAQKAIPGQGYVAGKYIASFVGFAPIRDPALVCAVVLDEPWPRYHGGEAAAPVFQKIATQVLLRLGVPPDRGRDETPPPAGRSRRSNVRRAAAEPRRAGADVEAVGAEVVRAEVPAGTVPDFAGLSARQAVSLSADAGLHLALNGHGVVARQSPSPGTPLEATGASVELWLAATGLVAEGVM
ncbi:MAG: transpeptidase family protein [bacterium]|nr:transpeptidase family protein [bacterium]